MIYGHSAMKDQFTGQGMGVGELENRESAEIINRQICRFAYKAVFAQASGQECLKEKHAGVSPVLQTTTLPSGRGQIILHEMVFGNRGRKPKWRTQGEEG